MITILIKIHPLKPKFLQLLALVFFGSMTISSPSYAEWNICSIDGQLSTQLTKYVQETDTLVAQLQKIPSSCWGRRNSGLISNTQRTLDVVDKAWAEIPVMSNLSLDFEYNIKMAFKWESRSAVVENGKIFQKVEQSLINGLDTLSNRCNLDESRKAIIIQQLQINHALETLYKETALGYPWVTINVPEKYKTVAEEITRLYNPTATQGCRNQYTYEKMSQEIITKIGSIGGGIQKWLEEWKYAIALIRWGVWLQEGKYNELKKRLLLQELQRQGFSAWAIDQMVKWYDCVEAAMNGDTENVAMSFAEAKAKCTTVSILGVDRFMKWLNKILLGKDGAKTTVSYIERVQAYKNIERKSVDAVGMYYANLSIFKEDLGTNDEMLTKLISLHITLLDVNDRIEKRVPIMQKNCMKAQSGIIGGCSGK